MIYNLAQSKNFKCIQDYTRHLSDYFRYALRQDERLVTLHAEMNFVLSFL
jgi:sensor histidine kinase YesM